MNPAVSDAFVRYLAAKRSVDDRALNRCVVESVRAHVPRGQPGAPVRVLDLGAGTTTMAARAVEWDLLRHADYTAVDSNASLIEEARRAIPEWAASRGLSCSSVAGGGLVVEGADTHLLIRLVHANLFGFPGGDEEPWDLLIASALLDLVNVPATLPRLWGWLRPGGLYWFTINFDGETIFLPEPAPGSDAEIEEQLIALYHRSMDGGDRSGDSRTGRRLFQHLQASGAHILAAGASDWVVYPTGGGYPAGEDVFLRHILDTIDQELRAHPELDAARFRAWVTARHRQIDEGRLVYIAHQLDFFGRAPGAAGPSAGGLGSPA